MNYFVTMIDYGKRGREAIVDPEITRRGVVSRIASGEYGNVLFIHHITMNDVPQDVTAELIAEATAQAGQDDISSASTRRRALEIV